MTKNPNKTPNSNKRKLSTTDIVLMLLGLFILIRTPWSNMSSFYYLLFFLYIFCIMMRITNLRKQYAKKESQQRKEAEIKAEIQGAEKPEPIMTAPGETISTEEKPSHTTEETPSQENPKSN
ncbi:hypothetical protein [Anaerotignum sp.]|uniref:hypothetical protein n=1 Tax=Anaerotignum sp. TaxID=2039241 RepID=UPI00331E9714